MKVELYLSKYATKEDLKNVTGVDTSNIGLFGKVKIWSW